MQRAAVGEVKCQCGERQPRSRDMDDPAPPAAAPPQARGEGALSPLSGSYLLIVVAEPHVEQHKDTILSRISKGRFAGVPFIFQKSLSSVCSVLLLPVLRGPAGNSAAPNQCRLPREVLTRPHPWPHQLIVAGSLTLVISPVTPHTGTNLTDT